MDPKEDLEAVVSWLEQGHWEEVDKSHNAEGSTLLISACQRGLSWIMHTLLEHAADVTLCNQSNQTVMHVCPPELREELLLAMPRSLLPPQAQLLQACWQGNLQLLRHWLAHSDVDVDAPNRDGLTALLLAVRDVDLFESLDSCLPWEHNPLGVVKELLALSVHLEVCDHRGYTALQYACEIKSSVRMEMVQIIMDALHQQALVNLDDWVDHEQCSESFFMPCCVLEQTSGMSEDLLQCLDCGPLSEQHKTNSQDKQTSKFSMSSTDTPREMRHVDKVERKESSQMRLLPKLPVDHYRIDIMKTTAGVLRSTDSNGISARSWADLNSKSALPGSSVPQSSLLSRSAPTIMEPFLDASSLLQVRTNINNRLTNTKEADEWSHKGCPSSWKIKTPRTLAPLKRGCRNGPVLSYLRAPRPLKPIGLLLQSSNHSAETANTARTDREGNHPCGSPRSLSIQGTERDNCDKESLVDSHEQIQLPLLDCLDSSVSECLASPGPDVGCEHGEPAGVMFEEGVCVRSLFDNKENCEFQQTDTKTEIVQGGKAPQTDDSNETHAEQIVSSEDSSTEAFRAEQLHSKSHPSTGDTPATGDVVKSVKSHSVSDTELCLVPTVDVIVSNEEHVLAANSQMVRCKKDRKGSIPFYNNNSFNVLACKNQNRKKSAIAFHVKVQDGKPDLVNKNMSKGIHTNAEQTSTRKQVTESVKSRRSSGDKKRLSNVRSQSQKQLNLKEQNRIKHLPEREMAGPPKAKSAVDYITYNDMFQEIMQGDDGPAIFEMFASPLYDRLRVARCSDRERQVQSAPPVKTNIQNVKNRCPKKVERKKKKQTDKSKPKRNRDIVVTGQLCNVLTSEEENNKSFSNTNHVSYTEKPEVMSSIEVNDETEAPEDERETMKVQLLSIIQEGLSQTSSQAPMLDNNLQEKYIGTSAEKRKASIQLTGNHQDIHEEPEVKVDLNTECNRKSPEIASSRDCAEQLTVGPQGPHTRTPSSEELTQLPLLQTYGDETEEEPLTDELMQCLVDELISLEEREIDTDHSDNTRVNGHKNGGPLSTQRTVHKTGGVVNMEGSFDDDAITWTKGEVLGRGAYGTVYCGLTSQGQLIAVKQVILDAMHEETAEKEYGCLQREVDLLKSLHHTNIVGFLGTSLSESVISIFMEYVPGGSIASVLHRFGPLPERVFAIYTQQILQGVAYLHSNRVIHRDLKGNNIMLMPTGVIKLIDFGCARRLSCLNQTGSHGTLLKSAHGTPYWMAPEVINETGHGRKSDIWSIGCTVYEMATGKPPLAYMDKMAALFYIGARQGLMPSLPDNFSKHAKHFVQACLISDQHQRPSAEQLLEHPFIPHRRWFD